MKKYFSLLISFLFFACDDGVTVADNCGDGLLDPAEQCDGANLGGADCTDAGFYFADGLACASNCTFDLGGCAGECGEGVLDDAEQCEGTNVGVQTCLTRGFSGGTLACDPEACTLDTTGCTGECGNGTVEGEEVCDDGNDVPDDGCSPGCQVDAGWTCNGIPSYCEPECGDGLIVGDETCDGEELNGGTCLNQGFYGGTLACGTGCAFDLSGCTGTCGDGVFDEAEGEECDGTDLGGMTCGDLGLADDGLACDDSCRFDTTGCIGWSSVSAGGEHTCAIDSLGRLWCWGANMLGQLAIDSTQERYDIPMQVMGLPGTVVKVTAGGMFTCALLANGSLWCWGGNSVGQLGIGNGNNPVAAPTQVVGMSSGVTDVSSGSGHACAVQNAALYCWGANMFGQLGNGSTNSSFSPVLIASDADPTRNVFTGNGHTCAIKDDGSVQCWGIAQWGQLGVDQMQEQLTPLDSPVGPLDTMALGGQFTCGLKSDHSLWCWGLGSNGQLGNGNTSQTFAPVQVSGPGNTVEEVTTGNDTACIVKNDHTIWCWGNNDRGQLGNGTGGVMDAKSTVPLQVNALGTNGASVEAGMSHVCAVLGDHTLWCWGSNEFGQLGNLAAGPQSLVPVMVGAQ